MGRGGLMVVKGTEQKNFPRTSCHVPETLPEFNDIYDGNSFQLLHEEVHEDVSYCTATLCQRVSSPGKPVPIELSIAMIPSDGSDPRDGHHGESCRAYPTPHEMDPTATNMNVFI
ncbi:hypothetical protein TNCV_937371 [Trichonephila clavipes]|nr:hypothetical protein TNCV_937371 [Trichonephila clavipes]